MAQEGLAIPRRALLVANPISGRGRGERLAGELARGFERRGVAAEVLLTRARGDAPRLLREAGPADLVVAVGGDGTLSEVLQGLCERTTPVGLLPCGTANVLAHALKVPGHPERALAGFLDGRIQALDVARAGERYAHLAVGVGFDARCVQEVEARRRGPITKVVYVGAVLRTLRRYRPVPLRVWIDGRELEQPVGMVWIANTPKYADVLRFARGTRLDDGQWEVYLFPTGRSSELLGAALRGLVLHLPGGPITMRRARSVRVESGEPVPYQIDGDLGGTTPVEFELLSEPFRLLVPRES
jgi:YegS/Rv2252/BmrU family lipid kinase